MKQRIKTHKPLLLLAAALSAAQLHAAEQCTDTTGANYVGEHRFTPSLLIPTPFAKPTLTSGLSLAILHPQSTLVSEDLDIAGAALSVEGQIPIIENLVLSLKGAGLALAGINTISALNFGASTGTRVQIGALYEFIDTQNLALTGALTIGKPKTYSVSPLVNARDFINNVTRGGSSDITLSTESTQWYPSIRAAYALNHTFGLQGSLGLQYFTAPSEGADSHTQMALTLGFDTQLKPQLNVPVALGLVYVRNQMLTRQGSQDTNTFAFSIFETFSPRFNFGTEVGWISLPDTTVLNVGIMSRYYY